MTVNFIDQEAGSEFLEDLLEQAMLLYTTVQGTCPGNRDFGITPLATDVPMPVADFDVGYLFKDRDISSYVAGGECRVFC